MRGRRTFMAVLLAVMLSGGMCLAGFSGTCVFLPSVGRAQGIANWSTAVCVHNPAGALIGKALEAFEGPGSGLVEVLVNVK